MQNKGNYILEEYISKTIGLTFIDKGSAENLVSGLPRYLKDAFHFSLVDIEEQAFLLMVPTKKIEASTLQIVKFAEQIRRQKGKPTLIQFKSMNSAKRRTLIGRKENFIVPEKQIYIPSLRIYLTEVADNSQLVDKEKLSPAAQLLILYHLQKQPLERLLFKDIAKVLSYSKKTISIVVTELQNLSICDVESIDERSKVLRFNKKGRELWNSVSSLMDSPIQKVWYIDKKLLSMDLPLSFNTALAHYTFMADSVQNSFAIDKKDFSEQQEKMQPFLHPEEGDARLEVWKYNPTTLANGQFIDKLSLALCYEDIDDERVNKEIDKLIDNIIW